MGDFAPDPAGDDDPLEGVGEAINDYNEEKENEILEGLDDAINDIKEEEVAEEEEQQNQPENEFSLFPDEDEEL